MAKILPFIYKPVGLIIHYRAKRARGNEIWADKIISLYKVIDYKPRRARPASFITSPRQEGCDGKAKRCFLKIRVHWCKFVAEIICNYRTSGAFFERLGGFFVGVAGAWQGVGPISRDIEPNLSTCWAKPLEMLSRISRDVRRNLSRGFGGSLEMFAGKVLSFFPKGSNLLAKRF